MPSAPVCGQPDSIMLSLLPLLPTHPYRLGALDLDNMWPPGPLVAYFRGEALPGLLSSSPRVSGGSCSHLMAVVDRFARGRVTMRSRGTPPTARAHSNVRESVR